MRCTRSTALLLCLVLLTAGAVAQTPAPAQGRSAVLDRIPSDTVAFIHIPNVRNTVQRTERWVGEIGLAELVMAQLPEGIMGALRGGLGLAPGWTGDGGAAILLLDPQTVGLDLAAEIAAAVREDREPNLERLPLLFLLPGQRVDQVFAQARQGDPYWQVTVGDAQLQATASNGFVIASHTPQAIEQFLRPRQAITVPQRRMQLLQAGEASVHVNMQVARPILRSLIEQLTQQMQRDAQDDPGATMMLQIMPFYQRILEQTGDMTAALRFTDTGLVFEQIDEYVEGSDYARQLAQAQAPEHHLLSRLPNNNYVLAVGGTLFVGVRDVLDMYRTMFGAIIAEQGAPIRPERLDQYRALLERLFEQSQEMQFVFGQAPEGRGIFGVACVVRPRQAQEFRTTVRQLAELTQQVVTDAAEEEPDLRDLRIRYQEALETVGNTPVDVISIEHPEMAEGAQEMTQALGEPAVRIRMAPGPDRTIVMTLGGASAYLQQSLQTAGGRGTIAASEGFAEAMRHMPQRPVMLMAFNLGNLIDFVGHAMRTMEPGAPPLPIAIQSRVPLMVGAAREGERGTHTVAYLPNATIRDAAQAVQGMMMMFMGGMMGPGPGMDPGIDMEWGEIDGW